MNPVLKYTLKERVINRILKYTFIYTREELTVLTLEELRKLQCKQFINLTIKLVYFNRHS